MQGCSLLEATKRSSGADYVMPRELSSVWLMVALAVMLAVMGGHALWWHRRRRH